VAAGNHGKRDGRRRRRRRNRRHEGCRRGGVDKLTESCLRDEPFRHFELVRHAAAHESVAAAVVRCKKIAEGLSDKIQDAVFAAGGDSCEQRSHARGVARLHVRAAELVEILELG
jgi:hypothetical protein